MAERFSASRERLARQLVQTLKGTNTPFATKRAHGFEAGWVIIGIGETPSGPVVSLGKESLFKKPSLEEFARWQHEHQLETPVENPTPRRLAQLWKAHAEGK